VLNDDVLKIEQLDASSVEAIKSKANQSKGLYPSSPALTEFQSLVFSYFTCFTFAAKGFALVRTSLPDAISETQSLLIGNGPPGVGAALSTMRVADAHAHLAKDGLFTDAVGKALLVLIYSEWDEKFRAAIGKDHGVGAKAVSCDLMGDVRHVRNWIVHNKSVIPINAKSLKVLRWQLAPGQRLVLTKRRFEEFMVELNRMVVGIGISTNEIAK
jgi:hypothetical protein